MNNALSAAQRRAVAGSDPVTGLVRAPAATLASLRRKGLAVAYGRVGATYPTETGLRAREDLRREAAPTLAPQPASATRAFAVATGDDAPGIETAEVGAALRRAEEVAGAWAGLLEVRRVSGAGPRMPASWERNRPVQAVTLALESAGLTPSGRDGAGRVTRPGYRVRATDEPGTVRVEWRTSADRPGPVEPHLAVCADALGRRGWRALTYRDRARAFLLASPMPAPGG